MDVNGTRFHLLLGERDWAPLVAGADFSWDERRHELTLGTRVFEFTPSPANRSVDVDSRRGAAADAYGNVYWIDASGTEILVHSAGSRATSHFWSSLDGCCPSPGASRHALPADAGRGALDDREPFSPREWGEGARRADEGSLFAPVTTETPQPIVLSGLAVTTQHYLVAGTSDPEGLLVFDLHRGGEPRQLLWPVPFKPFDIAAAQDGGVWVLDREHARAWKLDRTMGVVPIGGSAMPATEETFQPIDGSIPRCKQPSSITIDMARALTVSDAVAIEVLPDDSILILEPSRVLRIHRDGMEAEAALSLIRGHDFVFVAKRSALYVASSSGDQSVTFELDLEDGGLALHPIAQFIPMRLFGGRALISSPDGPLYDAQDRWVPLIEQRRHRFAREATLVIPKLDGKTPDCVWHRVMLDACIPPECDVIVESRATNDPALFELATWTTEPRLLKRVTGSELAWSSDVNDAGIDTWELLFQRAKGRYLQLRITLRGTGRSSPRVRALRVWYPRFSYLDHYLPSVYRESSESASFLDRFLANFEGFFTNIEDRIAAAQCLFDTRCAPEETLEWLASWFDVALDPAWDEEKRRLFLRHAADFFEWRGTVPGLMMALRLVSDECASESIFEINQSRRAGPRIVERFRARKLPAVLFGDTSDVTTTGLPLRIVRERWEPAAGAADLHRRWASAIELPSPRLRGEGQGEGRSLARYSIHAPSNAATRTLWTEFSRSTLGFVPSASSADTSLWQDVLQRRYTSIDALNLQYGTMYSAWSEVQLFDELPESVGALADWVHFEGLVLPARQSAHRFSVFLPQAQLGVTDREKRIDLARRVIALEKPAHTTFDVKFYWAFFRVGEARLGEDTIVDLGSRSPELLSAFILDRNYLGSGWLASEDTGGCR